MKKKELLPLILRYTLIIILGLNNAWIFYFVLTPLTVYSSAWILGLIYQEVAIVGGNTIVFNGIYADIVGACIAGSAYYLLTILNLSTQMKLNKRIKNLAFLFLAFFIINVIRIVGFAMLYYSGFGYFDLAHDLTWYVGSTIIVVLIWFIGVKIFAIKEIPLYSDVRKILKKEKKKKI